MRLILFAPAEKAILDSETNHISLISVISDFTFETSTEITMNATLPMPWRAVFVWRVEDPSEIGKEYTCKAKLLAPDGSTVLEEEIRFTMTKPSHRTLLGFPLFPIGQRGEYVLAAYLREGESWAEKYRYPISVTQSKAMPTS